MDAARDEVIAKELRLLEPGVRASPDAVRALLHDEFREFGASGAVWDRASIVPALSSEPGEPIAVREMVARRLADDVVLLTYTAQRLERTTLRSSVWVHDDGWRLLFHQGTVLSVETGRTACRDTGRSRQRVVRVDGAAVCVTADRRMAGPISASCTSPPRSDGDR